MRRIIVFLVVIISLALSFIPFEEVSAVVSDKTADCYIYQTTKEGEEFLKIDGKILYQKKADIYEIAKRIKDKDVVSVTVKVNGNYDVDSILKKFKVKIVDKQVINNKKIIYAYNKTLSGYNLCRNKKSNIQIVTYDNKCIVGIPVIVGSF